MTELALTMRSWGHNWTKLLVQSFAAQWIFYVVPVLFLLTDAYFFAQLPHHYVAPFMEIVDVFVLVTLPIALVVMLVGRIFHFALYIKPPSPLRALWQDIKYIFNNLSMVITALPLVLALFLFNKAMLEMKPEIPHINPFHWDEFFLQLDRTLHFGVDPWRILQPIMGYPIVTFVANLAYNFWFLALFGSWIWLAFERKPSELRSRFFVAYMLIWWIGGGLLALAFSSAGPCYFGKLGLATPDPYKDLMAYLYGVNDYLPIWALDTQNLLWDGYTGKSEAIGVSAFPSMHNGTAILFALTFRQISKGWGRFFTGYAILILLTSVHLGWHYAVDGYAAIIVSFACWWLAGPIARYMHRQPAMQRYHESLAVQTS